METFPQEEERGEVVTEERERTSLFIACPLSTGHMNVEFWIVVWQFELRALYC
jgi:hypothetical protein